MSVLTVGGLPGTGTSTLCRILEQRMGIPYVYAGQIFRDQAKARDMSLADFGALCQEDPAVDQALDDEQVRIMQRGDVLMEGRLSGYLAARHGVEALKVWVTCDEDERLRRIIERDGGDMATQRARTLAREASEADRYRRYYDIDLDDLSVYDLVLDSTNISPESLADAVQAALRTA